MKWSIQDILRKTDLFSKVTHTLGKLYYTSKLTCVQQNSGLIIRVWRFNSALWSSFIQWHKMWSGFRDLLYILARGEMMACWLFSKQLWHLPVDQGKNQIIQKSFNYTLTPLNRGWERGGGRQDFILLTLLISSNKRIRWKNIGKGIFFNCLFRVRSDIAG